MENFRNYIKLFNDGSISTEKHEITILNQYQIFKMFPEEAIWSGENMEQLTIQCYNCTMEILEQISSGFNFSNSKTMNKRCLVIRLKKDVDEGKFIKELVNVRFFI